ncbi:E3 ubiquitin-protein ligase ZNF598 [Leptidea sinapis]|uniref:E3 ubiquitin-protein ligase ZNF598 n=1 Tax=Leptidea sinapis TaxID=189913 RepID=UPI0021257F75|nr:E3 ubiquitin-protein ligase ZNF598 [Leptidea sinapis]XP_050670772.1 E3 ubiquitin-protein ligase ZNF598 [Leptidea sinapis]
MADTISNENTTCVVCFKNVLYFSIGECDHPVCFECSTRMRVLCLQNECPICRHDLAKVVFAESILPYKELQSRVFSDRLFERQFKIGFCSEEIKKAYDILLENRCKLCDKLPPFRTFSMLSDHTRKVHERYYCDLCVKHLGIFTSERKCYTRQELAHHRRKGDVDDLSHRGHPLCEFCEQRFMDADELYRHLRKEHLYCHLCDADGHNLYYATHDALAQHFRTEHYLCEEGECAGQHLTAVFRSDIDLKAHKATVHGRGMNRGAARQARTLELQFNISPHPNAVVQRVTRNRVETRSPSPPPQTASAPRIDPASDEQFPRLSVSQTPAPLLAPQPNRAYRGAEGLARTDRNFPALDGSNTPRPQTKPQQPPAASAMLRNAKPSLSIQVQSQGASASNFRLTPTSSSRITLPNRNNQQQNNHHHNQHDDQWDDFPALGGRDDHPSIGAGTVQQPKVKLINSEEMQSYKNNKSNHQQKKSPPSAEAFPALTSSSAPIAPPQWITVSKSNSKAKQTRKQPEPPPREPKYNPVADFPSLPVNSKPKKKVQIQPQPQPTVNPIADSAKKNKKKQNTSKKENNDANFANGVVERDEYILASVNVNNTSSEADRKIKTISEKPAENTSKSQRSDFALAAKEYPPLNPHAPSCVNVVNTGSVTLNNIVSRPAVNGKTPPGFKKRPPCDGMTFTNSSGQTFCAPVHEYIPPPDYELRNRLLVKKFAAALGDSAAMEDFKVASQAFRDSIIDADEFYRHCESVLGSKMDAVFAELIALLPDIAKQQELAVGRDVNLSVCSTCGQLISGADSISHDTAHWPPLASR